MRKSAALCRDQTGAIFVRYNNLMQIRDLRRKPLNSRRQKWVKFLCVMAFLSIGFSRMYLGCHTPKDVLVSMGLSLCITLLLWKYQAQILDQETHLKWITLLMMLLAIAAAIYAYVLYSNDTISGKYAADCLKASGAGLGFAIIVLMRFSLIHY